MKLYCGIVNQGVRCDKEAVSLLEDRIPVCPEHSKHYFRLHLDTQIEKPKEKE